MVIKMKKKATMLCAAAHCVVWCVIINQCNIPLVSEMYQQQSALIPLVRAFYTEHCKVSEQVHCLNTALDYSCNAA